MRRLVWLCLAVGCLLGCLLSPGAGFASGLGCCVILPLVSWCIAWLARGKVALRMEAPSVAEKGTPFSLSLRRTGGWIPTGPISVRLAVENTVAGEAVKSRILFTGEKAMTLESPWCGCLECRVERAWLWDFWGLLPVPVPTAVTKRILVMPRTFPVTVTLESAPAYPEDCQEYAQDRRGLDRTEVYQIREYVPGDSLSQIHWKLTSKRETLLVREPACPVEQSLLFLVDRTWGTLEPSQADTLMEAAASISQALCDQGVSFRLCWNHGETIERFDVTQERLPEAVGALLRSRTMTGMGGSELYLHTCGAPRAGRVLYLGTRYPEEGFSGAAPCKTLILGQDGFTPETAAEALRNLSWS